jgi:hypothetical protein
MWGLLLPPSADGPSPNMLVGDARTLHMVVGFLDDPDLHAITTDDLPRHFDHLWREYKPPA